MFLEHFLAIREDALEQQTLVFGQQGNERRFDDVRADLGPEAEEETVGAGGLVGAGGGVASCSPALEDAGVGSGTLAGTGSKLPPLSSVKASDSIASFGFT